MAMNPAVADDLLLAFGLSVIFSEESPGSVGHDAG